MTDIVTVALITAIPACGALLVSYLNGRTANATARKVDEAAKKTDVIIEKAAEIHTLADGNLSRMTAQLAVANQEIQGLKTLMAEMREAKVVLAAAVAAPAVTPPAPKGP